MVSIGRNIPYNAQLVAEPRIRELRNGVRVSENIIWLGNFVAYWEEKNFNPISYKEILKCYKDRE